MSQLENCIRGLHGRSVALNLTNRRIKKAIPSLTMKGIATEPYWISKRRSPIFVQPAIVVIR
jgi:hypothetical protein